MFYKLNRLERSAFAQKYLTYHKELSESPEKVQFSRTHTIFKGMNMVFVYFVDNYPAEELKYFVELSLIHHSYLHGFQCNEIGLLGVSKSFDSYIFGYWEPKEKKHVIEVEELEKTFSELGWKLKSTD